MKKKKKKLQETATRNMVSALFRRETGVGIRGQLKTRLVDEFGALLCLGGIQSVQKKAGHRRTTLQRTVHTLHTGKTGCEGFSSFRRLTRRLRKTYPPANYASAPPESQQLQCGRHSAFFFFFLRGWGVDGAARQAVP